MEDNKNLINENDESVELETYYVDGVKVTVERVFINSGRNMVERLFDLFENDNLEISSI